MAAASIASSSCRRRTRRSGALVPLAAAPYMEAMSNRTFPSFFLSHGSPTLALEPSAAGAFWKELGEARCGAVHLGALDDGGAALGRSRAAEDHPRLLRLPRADVPAELYGAGRARSRAARGRPLAGGGDRGGARSTLRARPRRLGTAALALSRGRHARRPAFGAAAARCALALPARAGARALAPRGRAGFGERWRDAQSARARLERWSAAGLGHGIRRLARREAGGGADGRAPRL